MFGHGRRIHEARIDAARFDAGLADEVLALASAQRLLASQLRTSGVLPITVAPIDDPAFQALAHEHAERMWELLDDLEMWPGTRIVGPEGATAAWQLVMAGDLDLQRRALDHLEIAVEFGDAPALHAAALEDRIRMREGRAQRYGTQVVPTADNRSLTPWPIEDPEHVEGRRAALGLEPLAEHLRALNARFH